MRALPERKSAKARSWLPWPPHRVGVHPQAGDVGEAGPHLRLQPLRAQPAVANARETRSPGRPSGPAPGSRSSGTGPMSSVRWCVRAMSQSGQRITWPQAGHWMWVEKPRRFNSRITCPPSSKAAAMAWCKWRLMAPRQCPRRRPRCGDRSCRRAASAGPAPGAASRPAGTRPACARLQLSSDGVAEPSTSGTSRPRPGRRPRRGRDTAAPSPA